MAGPLRGGNPGRRLIEPGSAGGPSTSTEIPEAFERRDGYLLVVPGYHAFGSEELSMLSPAIAELAPKPYIAVNPEDAARLIVGENELVDVALSTTSHYLPVRIAPDGSPRLGRGPDGAAGSPMEWPACLAKLLKSDL